MKSFNVPRSNFGSVMKRKSSNGRFMQSENQILQVWALSILKNLIYRRSETRTLKQIQIKSAERTTNFDLLVLVCGKLSDCISKRLPAIANHSLILSKENSFFQISQKTRTLNSFVPQFHSISNFLF